MEEALPLKVVCGLAYLSLQLVIEMLFLLKELYSLDCYCNSILIPRSLASWTWASP